MKTSYIAISLLIVTTSLAAPAPSRADGPPAGFTALFNGKDLSGIELRGSVSFCVGSTLDTGAPGGLLNIELENLKRFAKVELLSIDTAFGGWQKAQKTHFADGGVFDLTDIRVENPYNDRGIATLLVNSEPLFIWSLENIRGSFFEPRITPIRLDPGDNVTFSVKCDEIGDTGRSTCTNAVVIIGRTITDDAG